MSVYIAAIAPSHGRDPGRTALHHTLDARFVRLVGAIIEEGAPPGVDCQRGLRGRWAALSPQPQAWHECVTRRREAQVRRLRTGLSSDDCYDYTFIILMLLHLPLLNLIISLNIDCAQKEQRHIQPPSYMEPQHASTTYGQQEASLDLMLDALRLEALVVLRFCLQPAWPPRARVSRLAPLWLA